MNRRYRHDYRVRYDECDLYGHLTPAGALRLMQDVAGLDAADANLPEGGNWIARRTLVDFAKRVPIGATLEAETYPLGFTKITAQRGYDLFLRDKEGRKLAIRGRTMWVYFGENNKPGRIPASFHAFWLPGGPHLQTPDPEWPPFPERAPFSSSYPVRFSDLDGFFHMNNAAYAELLDDAGWVALGQVGLLPDTNAGYPIPLHYDIDYLDSAKAGDILEVRSWYQPSDRPDGFERLQQVTRGGQLLVRALSRWRWRSPSGAALPGELRGLF